jgi:Transposase, Mutator family
MTPSSFPRSGASDPCVHGSSDEFAAHESAHSTRSRGSSPHATTTSSPVVCTSSSRSPTHSPARRARAHVAKGLGTDLSRAREIYTAPTVEAADHRFADFVEHCQARYPAMIAVWESSWAELVPFLDFPVELRTIVYTANAIESLNARFRKAVRHRARFPTEQAALKVLYLAAIW